MGKAEDNKRKKRESLLKQAYDLFIMNGISNTSIAQIAERAGVGKGTFYSYFTDKDELIDRLTAQKAEGLLITAVEELKKREAAAADADTTMSAEDKIIAMCDILITELDKDPKLLRFLNKRLNLGFYKKAYNRDDFLGHLDIRQLYLGMLGADGAQWKDPALMLYTIVEMTGSTIHTVIINSDPVSLEEYKPILFDCIRSVMQVFKK